MKIATLQLNLLSGAIEKNTQSILQKIKEAYAQGARLIITSELALYGGTPSDLLLRPDFLDQCQLHVKDLAEAFENYTDLYILLGHPYAEKGLDSKILCYNAASLLHAGHVQQRFSKQTLSDAGVAAEPRYFSAGTPADSRVFELNRAHFGVLWGEEVLKADIEPVTQDVIDTGAQILLVLCSRPYAGDNTLEEQISGAVQQLKTPVLMSQMAGGYDALVYAGGSFVVNSYGEICARAKSFDEDVFYIDAFGSDFSLRGALMPRYDAHESLWRALVLGLKDYVRKNGFSRAALGLSGGMDSALVVCIAVDALGAENVMAMMMPSQYTSAISLEDARTLSQNLGVDYTVIPVTETVKALQTALSPVFEKHSSVFRNDTTEENLQARVRGNLLMALSNRTGALVLSCGNKSEGAVGYCTLYGDTAGGFSVIKDVPKTTVYELALWRNQHDIFGRGQAPIPERIITRAPSAELREGQTDQDNLPPYDVLDGILIRYMEENQSIENIVDSGYRREDVEKIIHLIKISEYKRQQSPLGTKVSPRSFGIEWRYPVTPKY